MYLTYDARKESIISPQNLNKNILWNPRGLLFVVFLQNLTPTNNEGRLYFIRQADVELKEREEETYQARPSLTPPDFS